MMRGWCAGVFVAALLAGRMATGADAAALVRKVQQRYDATQTLTANVTEEMTVSSLNKTTKLQGTLAFKKPGKMRWELDHDNPQVIVADGTTLWLYQPNEHQVLKTPFDAAFRSTTPISFLTGVGNITSDFDATVDGQNADGTIVDLALVPHHQTEGIGHLRLSVEHTTGDIVEAEIRDPLGNVSRLQFSNIRRNVPIPEDRFVFQVPPGTDVVTAPVMQ